MQSVVAFKSNDVQVDKQMVRRMYRRLVTRIGLPLRRFGDGQAQRVGKVLSVACWLDVNEQFRQAVGRGEVTLVTGEEAA